MTACPDDPDPLPSKKAGNDSSLTNRRLGFSSCLHTHPSLPEPIYPWAHLHKIPPPRTADLWLGFRPTFSGSSSGQVGGSGQWGFHSLLESLGRRAPKLSIALSHRASPSRSFPTDRRQRVNRRPWKCRPVTERRIFDHRDQGIAAQLIWGPRSAQKTISFPANKVLLHLYPIVSSADQPCRWA